MTDTTRWTPGPWHVNAIAKGRVIGDETAVGAEKLQINATNRTVATVYRPHDARLIATAPLLVEALERIAYEPIDLAEAPAVYVLQQCVMIARAALAAARGETP